MADSKLFIPVLFGTVREGRESIRAAKLVYEVGLTFPEIEVEFVDPRYYSFPADGNDAESKDARYSALTARADGFFIVTPEYNHSFPSTIKRMLDSELKNYIHKPVAFAGASDGPWGGVRAIEALVTTVREMGLVATFTDVQFPFVQKLYAPNGELSEPKQVERIKRAYRELIWMARALKYGRENLDEAESASNS